MNACACAFLRGPFNDVQSAGTVFYEEGDRTILKGRRCHVRRTAGLGYLYVIAKKTSSADGFFHPLKGSARAWYTLRWPAQNADARKSIRVLRLATGSFPNRGCYVLGRGTTLLEVDNCFQASKFIFFNYSNVLTFAYRRLSGFLLSCFYYVASEMFLPMP